ncbi:hypothetical protein EDC32_101429 [Laceyella sacchari]|nr:hypothetical protein EDC32_101429 [Laceyella sacchari]
MFYDLKRTKTSAHMGSAICQIDALNLCRWALLVRQAQ